MTDAADRNLADRSMLGLFCSEVDAHGTTLTNGLLDLENNPSDRAVLDALMRAVHSIKGGARIVELSPAVRIAHIMEDCFEAVRRQQIAIGSDHIDILLRGRDMLTRIAETAAETGIPAVPPKAVDQMVAAIRGISGSPPPVTDTEPEKAVPAAEPALPEPSAAPAMLSLFRSEMQSYGQTFRDGLNTLEKDPGNRAVVNTLKIATNAIKGGARIVEISPALRLICAVEDYFETLETHRTALNTDHLSLLREGTDLLNRIAETAAENGTPDIPPQGADRLAAAIGNLISGGALPAEALPEEVSEAEPATPTPVPEPSPAVTRRPATDTPGTPASLRADSGEMPASPEYRGTTCGFDPSDAGAEQRVVRVTAGKIERLMGLAGEVVVSARWLPSFSESLLNLKRNHAELTTTLDKLQKILEQAGDNTMARKLAFDARKAVKACNLSMADRVSQLEMFTSVSANLSDRLYHEVISVRMCPFSDGTRGFPRLVRDLARTLGKKIRLEIVGKSTEVDRDILEKLDAPLNHLLRNAVDHGIDPPAARLAAGKSETGTIRLEAVHRAGMLMITVSDDGRGIEPDALRERVLERKLASREIADRLTDSELMEFLFLPGFSTSPDVTEISGRGVGLDVVHSIVHDVGGVVRAVSDPGRGMHFHLELPLTLSVIRTFLVGIGDEPYAFPLARIERCLRLEDRDIEIVEDRQYFRFNDNNIALVGIHEVLELDTAPHRDPVLNVVVVRDRMHAYGLVVDKFLGECDLVVRPLDSRLGKVPDISAAAVMLDGSPVLIFDVEDLIHSIGNLLAGKRRLRKIEPAEGEAELPPPKRILVVEDSFIVREKERKLLENRGYEVEVAVDGMDGWNLLRTAPYDLVVSDIDMPRMNGFELIRSIKQHDRLRSLPVIIVSYKITEEDRLTGLDAGADYYLTKSEFDDHSLINAVIDLIGEP
ncbi:hybrid sensor histidine kinase/response regulato r [Desulfonema ishimotonii]|uniref:histidine kinase n=1 Tax=Desulfonema ishimotonii TaxID=45657 RepID=A0A401G2D2_9BACT|nr:hybrid sensor histidine kinase/response regulator [Desulfonema ishimotonii]GBC63402.1 hybrid sensor histidine kinase/response regulato r [Desulfonema ishimotonii]